MQTDKELIQEIKNSFDFEPREEFVQETKQLLSHKSKRLKYHRYFIEKVKYLFATTLSLALIVWLTTFNGTQFIINSFETISSSMNKNENINYITENSEEAIFIYQTHNRESFFPILDTTKLEEAFHKKQNITKVGGKITSALKLKGVNVIHDKTDIMQLLEDKGMQFGEAYSLSRKIVKDKLKSNKEIKLFLDIHRDSTIDKNKTSTTLKGEIVPKISFIVSKDNRHYKKNLEVAEIFYKKFQENYPGIAKIEIVGGKSHGIYSQDLSSNVILIEIGGVSNTLEEEYRGAELLSNIIIEVLNEI